MSYSDREHGEGPYVQYRKVRARKSWQCAYAKSSGAQCDGTIHPGEAYIDEAWVPWTPEYDETGEDDYGRPTVGQVGVVGSWSHSRYHEACERITVEHQLYGTPAEQARWAAEEAARAAKERADRDAAEKAAQAARKARQQRDSRQARRAREIAAHAAEATR